MIKVLVVVLACMLATNCASPVHRPPFSVQITVEQPDRVRFFGKGAGAGMMLSSSMGPMGVAIGIAIDEGIGKDIDENARAAGFSIVDLLQGEFEKAVKRQAEWHRNASKQVPGVFNITVKRYGFMLEKGGSDDSSSPELIVVIDSATGPVELSYPGVLLKEGSELPVWTLAQLKTDVDSVRAAFSIAASNLFAKYLEVSTYEK